MNEDIETGVRQELRFLVNGKDYPKHLRKDLLTWIDQAQLPTEADTVASDQEPTAGEELMRSVMALDPDPGPTIDMPLSPWDLEMLGKALCREVGPTGSNEWSLLLRLSAARQALAMQIREDRESE